MTRTILVVDDEISARMSIELTLTMAGYNVTGADSAPEAIDLLLAAREASYPYDLLVSDMRMPGMTGLELVSEIKSLGLSVTTLMITGFADSGLVRELDRLGCRDCCEKPVDPKALTERVGEIFSRANGRSGESATKLPNPFRLPHLESLYKSTVAGKFQHP